MSSSLKNAAQELLEELHPPRGAINTQMLMDESGPFIRTSIDPQYWFWSVKVPSTYHGYRVVVEERKPTVAHA